MGTPGNSSGIATMTVNIPITIKQESVDTSFCTSSENHGTDHNKEHGRPATDSICIKTEPYDISYSALLGGNESQDELISDCSPDRLLSNLADSCGKKHKSPNWTEDETLQLIREVSLRKKVITGKFTKDVTNVAKRKAWEEITTILNRRFPQQRRKLKDVKKRWENISSRMRKQYHEMKLKMNDAGAQGQAVKMSPIMAAIMDVTGFEPANVIAMPCRVDTEDDPMGEDMASSPLLSKHLSAHNGSEKCNHEIHVIPEEDTVEISVLSVPGTSASCESGSISSSRSVQQPVSAVKKKKRPHHLHEDVLQMEKRRIQLQMDVLAKKKMFYEQGVVTMMQMQNTFSSLNELINVMKQNQK